MKHHRLRRSLALMCAMALLVAACGDDDDTGGDSAATTTTSADGGGGGGGECNDPGITDTTIKLGNSNALSGPASAYGTITTALKGYVDYVNEDLGGVTMADGKTRQIELVSYDDGYDPPKMVENVRRLVEEDQVFALWATLGTPTNTAVWDYVQEQEVPHLFLATGASKWGFGFVGDHPWTIGWQPAYTTEAAIYGQYLKDNMPDATVAILEQNDDYGKDYVNGFKAAIEGSGIEVVAEQTYETSDPTVDQQVTELASSNADVFFNVTTPKFAAQAISKVGDLDWSPLHILNSVSASVGSVLEPAGLDKSTGILTAQYIKEPSDPTWADDEAMNEYKDLAEQYAPDADPENPFTAYGFAQGDTMKQLLEASDCTRQSVIDNVGNMDGLEVGLLLPGVKVTTDKAGGDGFPIESMQLSEFDGTSWQLQGDLISYEGKTPEV